MAMKFPQYVSTSDRTVSVVGMVDKNNEEKETQVFQDNKGYIDEDQFVWIFCSSGKPKNKNAYPYFWLNEEGKKEFSDPSEIIKKAFSVSNMVDMSLVNIVDKTEPGEQLFNEEEINDMNAAAAFYVPTIKDKDDFLKKIVKTTIIEKGIDINRLKGKTDQKYQLPNMKAALQSDTKMSVVYFINWMNLFGCDFEITILDTGEDKTDPLKNPLVYQSYSDKLSNLVDGDLIEVNTGKYVDEEDDDE